MASVLLNRLAIFLERRTGTATELQTSPTAETVNRPTNSRQYLTLLCSSISLCVAWGGQESEALAASRMSMSGYE